jgi:hypothetical protein
MIRRAVLAVVVAGAMVTWWIGSPRQAGSETVKLGAPAPEVAGGPWIGSSPLTIASLRGRVALVEFWTFG